MATERTAASGPVCGESFREAPARCFRCESDLELWWPLDESLRALEGESFPVPAAVVSGAAGVGRWFQRNVGWLVPVALLAGLAGALWLSLESTRRPAEELTAASSGGTPRRAVPPKPVATAEVAPAAGPTAAAAPVARTIRYVVQPGDSLWRIAAALKGDARRWPELLANASAVDPARLRPGQELLLVVEGGPFLPQTVAEGQ